jgi:hypothetical protein
MSTQSDRVWVSLDYLNGGQVASWRGLMDSADLEAIVSGGFTQPFVVLESVHWVESIWSEAERRHKLKLTVSGRDGTFRWHQGTLYLRPESISNIGLLGDCSKLVRGNDRLLDEE